MPTEPKKRERVKTIQEISSTLLERHFPKGKCQERGYAIVLIAELLIHGSFEASKMLPKAKVRKLFGIFC